MEFPGSVVSREPSPVFSFLLLMSRFLRLLMTLLVGLSGIVLPLGAQSSDENKDTTKTNRRAVSKNIAAALAQRMPKYDPPKKEEKKPDEDQDMREVDKPRNRIIRLPAYVVRQEKAPVFRERDIHTDKGLAELAMKRYLSETSIGLNKFTIPLFGVGAEAYSLMLYQQDERLKNISDLDETAKDIDQVDPENAQEIREATRDTYGRGFDYRYRTR